MILRRISVLNGVLAEMDESFLPNGRKKVFSIRFVEKSGKLTYLPFAISVGLKANMRANDLKAVQPVDKNGNMLENGHVYPIWIHAIVEFNGMKL